MTSCFNICGSMATCGSNDSLPGSEPIRFSSSALFTVTRMPMLKAIWGTTWLMVSISGVSQQFKPQVYKWFKRWHNPLPHTAPRTCHLHYLWRRPCSAWCPRPGKSLYRIHFHRRYRTQLSRVDEDKSGLVKISSMCISSFSNNNNNNKSEKQKRRKRV